VDVSKAWLDAWIEAVGHKRFANTPEAIAALARWALEHGAELVVMEASGGYEQPVYLTLWRHGCPCAIANPKAVRHFAKAMGYLEKTDRIDAQVIAGFATAKQLKAMAPPSPQQRQLTELAARLRQLTADLSVQKQRLHTTREPLALASLKETIAFFKRQIEKLAEAIGKLIQGDPLWQALDATLRSVKGVADRTVTKILADLPEIGTVSNRAIAKLAGLAPIANDSGQRSGPRPIRGGRPDVRSVLFLVADIARKYDPSLADFRDRLLAKGKPKMAVRIALARKLLVRLNAKARETRAQFANGL
jgi:transposase